MNEKPFIKLYAETVLYFTEENEETDKIELEIEKELEILTEKISKKFNVRMEIN